MIESRRLSMSNIIFFVILLAAMNFMLQSTVFILFAFLLMLIRDKKVFIDHTAVFLAIFVLSYIISYIISIGIDSNIFVVLTILLSYMLGFSFSSSVTVSSLQKRITYISVGMASHSILNLVYNLSQQGLGVFRSGVTIDFWSKSISAATGQAMYYCYIIGLLGFLFFSFQNHKSRIILLIVYLLALVHCFLVGSRIFIFLSFVSLLVGVVFTLVYSKTRAKIIRILVILGIVFAVGFILFRLNIFGIQDIYKKSYFYYRFHTLDTGLIETTRLDRRLVYYQNLLRFPFGGCNIRRGLGVGYAHELWLDLFDEVGLIPYILLWIYTIISLRDLRRFLRRCSNFSVSLLVTCTIVTLFVSFFGEPILSGRPMVFSMYCFIHGSISRYIKAPGQEQNLRGPNV